MTALTETALDMSNYQKQILTWFEELERNREIRVSNVSHLMSLCRHLLEDNHIQSKYPHLKFYCDWSLHPKLDRSRLTIRILDQISDELSSPGPKEYNDVVLELIGLQHLRKELLALFVEFALPTHIFESRKQWTDLVSVLLNLLMDKPLTREIPQSSVPLPGKPWSYALSLRLGLPETDPALSRKKHDLVGSVSPGCVYWIVECNVPDVQVIGSFNLPELDSAFKNP